MKKYFELIKNYSIVVLIKASLSEIYRKIWREKLIGSYAQNYEDLIINKLFSKIKKGVYLEIGAYDPARLSNTYRFYKKGWRGIVIEPNPSIKNKYKKMRPEDRFLNLGVSDKNGFLDYYEFFIPAINTFSKSEYQKNLSNDHKLKNIIKIKIIDIDDLIKTEKIKHIDFLSIDTEGFDEKIVRAWPWKICKPKVICTETDLSKLLAKKGYRLIEKTKYNFIFRLYSELE